MIEITNRKKGPVQLVIRSRKHLNNFTTLCIPGIGSGKNVYLLADELMTEVVSRVEGTGDITTKYVKNIVTTKGE
jgi:hypothetical protein